MPGEQLGSIYKITNKLNDKVYIGKTERTVEGRWLEHIKKARKPLCYVDRAINLYGKDVFCVEVIEKVDPEQLSEREKYWIAFFNSTDNTTGYNLTFGGEGGFPTDEVRRHISIALTGKHPTDETRRRMGDAHRGLRWTEEQKEKLSLDRMGRVCWWRGKHMSEATRSKMSEAQKGKILSDEHKRKLGLLAKGRIMSNEQRQLISQTLSGKKHSEERITNSRHGVIEWWRKRKEAMA